MRFAALFLMVFHSLLASAQMYSWKDAKGKIHYSDEPPPDQLPVRKVAPPPPPAADPAALQRTLAERENESRKRQKSAQEAAAKADKERADGEERRANCEKAQGNLKSIESGQVRFTIDSKGERVALDGAVREAELANAKRSVDTWCK
ncbi:MAG: DUF4124 domain-containing protein [Sterolibacteriaceae bacterium MAG5]|nr:DUF4124 domain-containing protein [Candidatus Nitricoxidireducens bremensis]